MKTGTKQRPPHRLPKGTRGVPFKPGQSGNPNGRPPTFEGIVKKLRKGEIPARFRSNPEAFHRIVSDDPRAVAVGHILIANYKGEPWAIKTILDHCGIMKNTSELANLPPVNVIVTIPDNGRRMRELLPHNDKVIDV